MDTFRRNDVAWKGLQRLRIHEGRRYLCQDSRAHQFGRHGCTPHYAGLLPESLNTDKEESLVVLQRAADGASELIPNQRWLGHTGGSKQITGVQVVVP